MLKPSINEVLDKIDNRYYLVGTVAKRAREIIDGAEVYVSAKNRDNNKPVTIATQEVADEKITFRLLTQEEIDKKEEVIIEKYSYPIRKLAHYSLYFILGILSFLVIVDYKNNKKLILYSMFICFLYACTDEFHQLFIAGRSA